MKNQKPQVAKVIGAGIVAGAALFLAAGAGCLEPTVRAFSDEGVTLVYDARAHTQAEVADKARQLCNSRGGTAQAPVVHNDEFDPNTRIARFACTRS